MRSLASKVVRFLSLLTNGGIVVSVLSRYNLTVINKGMNNDFSGSF